MISGLRDSRFIIGIDLGTTNSVVSFVDRYSKDKKVEEFKVQQLIAAGETDACDSLPSFCYLPLEHELEKGTLELPWQSKEENSIGVFSRNHGSGIPERFISSAKSWLSHKGVDRMAGILPWGSEIDANLKLSPVDVSRLILNHIREAWNFENGKKKDKDGSKCTLEESQVIITVPASFDETARELTVEAAKKTGYKHITLLEEPLAAFYSWLEKNENWEENLSEGDKILIVDIGGGTTDFSLINFEKGSNLRRTAVGNHLLLGGDNIDMTLARKVESQLKKKLNPREWSILCQRCRQAKEELLDPNGKEEVTVAISTSGSSLVGNTVTGKLNKEEVLELIMEGFYPLISVESKLPEKKGGIRDLALPYERDPSVSAHLLSFLKKASENDAPLIPDKILFNGGSMIPVVLRERIIELLNSWSEKKVDELQAWNLDKAVATGAGYYGLVRYGEGVRVQGGIARAYYMEIASADGSKLICIMPRDTNEGEVQTLSNLKFKVRTNEALKFPVHSSATRLKDKLEDQVSDREEISELPPLITSLQFGKTKKSVEVEVSTVLNETGTLEVWLNSTESQHKWQLKFDMRALHSHSEDSSKAESMNQAEAVIVSDEQMKEAEKAIQDVFNGLEKPGKLIKKLEDIFEMNRNKWSLQLIRQMADFLLNLKDEAKKSAPLEARWMNLLGFCLRPGFGDSADEFRIKQLWTLWFGGPNFKTDAQVNAEWWVLWRRISGGLNNGRQEQIAHTLMKSVMPNDSYKKNTKYGPQEKMESWRCLASLERISTKLKKRITDVQLERISRLEDYEYWTLARLNARKLFYGPADLTASSKDASSLANLIQSANSKPSPMALFTISHICALTGDKHLDVNEKALKASVKYLETHKAQESYVQHLKEVVVDSAEESKQVLGDSLPIGLELT